MFFLERFTALGLVFFLDPHLLDGPPIFKLQASFPPPSRPTVTAFLSYWNSK